MAREINFKRIFKLQNMVQHYAWGSASLIPGLLGIENKQERPFAELWMGSHIKAPSYVHLDGEEMMSVRELINLDAAAVLGKAVIAAFGSELPFLFKILAAAAPLSIQVHPSKEQAIAGFTNEEMQAIPLAARNRNYKDTNHKPELLVALSEFSLMQGFKEFTEIKKEFDLLGCGEGISAILAAAEKQKPEKRLVYFFTRLMALTAQERNTLIPQLVARAEGRREPECRWLRKLQKLYPSDIGVLSPLILNVCELKPGQAVFSPAGVLHSYLGGFGLEIMANSDNVLRGGLTPKHVDVAELLKVVTFKQSEPHIITPSKVSAYESTYTVAVKEFCLSKIVVKPAAAVSCQRSPVVEILLVLKGEVTLSAPGQRESMAGRRGDSFLVPAAVKEYKIEGEGELFKAFVNV
ncbi:MAG: mannose-6-phosphate isomerase, class I [Spirochaetales bacterium]|nr:mannose-6-phosphate isomerase, class I [Spirochaetales bacterium]